ncbi:ABC transporter substrate-binding protein [Dolosigranulum pigrum]|uniref:ABC transporter substrate-binding protein n=1 Tax=Dolosigranulum pigrum TaxID=29394 RepID=UPI001AD869D8|nr:ABC transporter substrate-binding protein [Dolosigranulum pigrum]QTJ54521.1 oligopeptide ABC transporter substrate-binding protein [Dolosigranulum pigrum]
MLWKKRYNLLATIAAMSLILVACGGSGDTGTIEETSEIGHQKVDTGDYSLGYGDQVINEGEPIEGGTLNIGLIADSAWTGILNPVLWTIDTDAALMGPIEGTFLTGDEDYKLVGGDEYGAAADIEYKEEANEVTITVKDGVKWHDGEPLTADDLVFAYEVIGHPDYTGVRYGDTMKNIVGMEEYRNGETETIKGMTLSDDKMSVTIKYHEFKPNMYSSGGGIWQSPIPRHYLEDIPVGDLEQADEVRVKPIGFGPFKVKNISDTAVEYEAFTDYHLGAPKIDSIILKRVPTSSVISSLHNAEYDWITGLPTDKFENYKDGIPGYQLVGHLNANYSYIGFKLGKWNSEEGQVEYDPEAKMSDKNLRQAMAYALDLETLSEQFYSGLRHRATSHIPPTFDKYFNDELEGYPHDPDKANQLLDEASYEWPEGEDYRLDKDGNPLTINFVTGAGSDIAEEIALYYQQAWASIGLNVEYSLKEINALFDDLEQDAEGIDVYSAGWNIGHDPTPHDFHAPNSAFNYPRYATEEHTALLDKIQSDEAFDDAFRTEAFKEWQAFRIEEVPEIPALWTTSLSIVNNRVSAFVHGSKPGTAKEHETFGLHQIQLLAEEPMSEDSPAP